MRARGVHEDARSSESGLLADAAMALLGCRSEQAVFDAIASLLGELCPGSVIIVNELAADGESLTTRSVVGVDDEALSQASRLLGFEVIGRESLIVPEYRDALLRGTLWSIPGGFIDFASTAVPVASARACAALFGFSDVFIIGIADQQDVLGNAQILTREPDAAVPVHEIESFIHQCFSALSVIRSARELASSVSGNDFIVRSIRDSLVRAGAVFDKSGRVIDYVFLEANPAFEILSALKAEDIVGRRASEVMPELDEYWAEGFGDVVTTGIPAKLEGYSEYLGMHLEVLAYSPAPGQIVGVGFDVTARTRAEEALAASEARFRKALSASPVPMALADGEQNITFMNGSLHRALGYTIEDIPNLAQWWLRAYPDPEYRRSIKEAWQSELERVASTGDVFTPIEAHVRCADGTDKIMLISDAALGDRRDGFVAAMYDVTESRRAQQALAASEARFATAFRASPDAMIISRLSDGRCLEINEGLTEITGFTAEEVVGKTSMDIRIWNDPADRQRLVEELTALGTVSNLEAQFRRKDGRVITVLMSAHLVELDGEPCILSVSRDISERKRDQDALRDSEARYRAVSETVTSFVYSYLWDSSGVHHVDWMAGALEEVTGYTFEDVRKHGCWRFMVLPEDIELFDANHFELHPGQRATVELRIVRADGAIRWLRSSARGQAVGGGTAARRVVGACEDITERKRLDEALQRRVVALTQPPSEVGGLTFHDVFDVNEIQAIQDAFATATGVASVITAPDGSPITRPSNFRRLCDQIIRGTDKGLQNCCDSDAAIGRGVPTGPIVQTCLSGGLWDAGAAITAGGEHIASWLIGQVLDEGSNPEQMLQYADEIGVDREAYRAALSEVPVMAQEQFRLIAESMHLIASRLSVIAYQNVQQARFITEHARVERELAQEQERGLERLRNTLYSVVEIVSQVTETRDPYTAGHQRRVAELAVRIAETMGLPAADVDEIRIAALVHDIGKMGVPAEILTKPGKLSDIEFEIIKSHSEAGHKIITSARLEGAIAEIVLQHHERCDGSGYPSGLTAGDLLQGARVLMVADVVEAMMLHRPYRPGLGQEAALDEIEQGAGRLYDADVAAACLEVFREQGFAFTQD